MKLVRDCYVYSGLVKGVQVHGAVSASQLPATSAWLIKAFTETSLVHSVLSLTGYLKSTASNYHEKMEDAYTFLSKWSWAGKMLQILWFQLYGILKERREKGWKTQITAAGLGEVGMGSWNIEIQRLSLGHTSPYIFQQAERTGPRMNSHRNSGARMMMCKWGNGYWNRRTTPELGSLWGKEGQKMSENLCTFQLCCGSETVLKMSIPFSKIPNMLYSFHTNIQAPHYTYIRVFIWTKRVQLWFSTWDMYNIYCLDDHYQMKLLALCWLCILFFILHSPKLMWRPHTVFIWNPY